MNLLYVGRHCFNLAYLIRHEQGDGSADSTGRTIPIGTVRVTMLPGDQIDLTGQEAATYLDEITKAQPPPRSERAPKLAVLVIVNPATAETNSGSGTPTASRPPKKTRPRRG